MKRILSLSLLLFVLPVFLCAAKVNEKQFQKSLLSITSYDKEGKILKSGCAFYIDNSGTCLASYDIFKDAYSAEVTNSQGKKFKVERICGSNSLYNLVRFTTEKVSSVTPLKLAPQTASKDASVTIISNNKELPWQTTTIQDVQTVDSINYYTLTLKLENTYAGAPVFNTQGEVVAILQTNQNRDNTNSYALDIAFADKLQASGVNATERSLYSIHIPKQLPADEAQARTYIFLAQNGRDTDSYLTALADYISAYPSETHGYLLRANYWVSQSNYEKASADYELALQNATNKAEVRYELSRVIYRLCLQRDYTKYQDWDMEKALSEVSQAVESDPQPLYTLHKAECEFALRKYDESFNSYQIVNQSNVASPQSFDAAAIAAEYSKKDSTIVLALIDSAIVHSASERAAATYILQRASHLDQYGRYKEAALDYQKVEDIYGTRAMGDNFFYVKSTCETRARLYARALSSIEKALSLQPDDYGYTVEKALAHWRMGNYDEAIFAADQALKIEPNGADAYKAKGLALGEEGKKAEALRCLEKAKELGDPQAEKLMQSIKER